MISRIAQIDIEINGESVSYPFHFGMSTIRSFAAKKGWIELPFTKLLQNIIGEDASFVFQTDFFVHALKAGLNYTGSKLPLPPETDIQENFTSILKACADTIAAYLTDGKKVEEQQPDEVGKY